MQVRHQWPWRAASVLHAPLCIDTVSRRAMSAHSSIAEHQPRSGVSPVSSRPPYPSPRSGRQSESRWYANERSIHPVENTPITRSGRYDPSGGSCRSAVSASERKRPASSRSQTASQAARASSNRAISMSRRACSARSSGFSSSSATADRRSAAASWYRASAIACRAASRHRSTSWRARDPNARRARRHPRNCAAKKHATAKTPPTIAT